MAITVPNQRGNPIKYAITIPTDKEGYIGRECPTCEKYFKIKPGTGLPGVSECRCPYCNYLGQQDQFWTKQQVEYAQSIVINRFERKLLSSLKTLERKPDVREMFSIGITVKGGTSPIAWYSEKQLEEWVTCTTCALEYTIYGTFGYCPDCGVHNSLQIVNANFDLILKILALAGDVVEDVSAKLIENSLEDAVSSFDGFAREHCSKFGIKLSFQNIAISKDKLLADRFFDISKGLETTQWRFVCEQFQKRHLLAHRLGIVDKEFITKTNGSLSAVGRKILITDADVKKLIDHLRAISKNLFDGIV